MTIWFAVGGGDLLATLAARGWTLSDLEFLAPDVGRKLRFLSPRVNINIKFATTHTLGSVTTDAHIKGPGPRGTSS